MKHKSSRHVGRAKRPAHSGVGNLFSARPERLWLFAIILVAATILLYQPAWNGGFLLGDDPYITKNPFLTAPGGLGRGLVFPGVPAPNFSLSFTPVPHQGPP